MGNLIEIISWTRKERIALIILSTLLLFLISGNLLLDRIYHKNDHLIHPDTLLVYESILKKWEEVESKSPENTPISKIEISKNRFDPNKLDVNGWIEYGFSYSQSQSLIKFKNAIGGFKTKEDLKKSFVISESKFEELKGLIIIEKMEFKIENEVSPKTNELFSKTNDLNERKDILINLNECDSVSLLKLKGIGPYFAGKIVAYRTELGGYVSKNQLLEIWNFDSLRLSQIEDHISIEINKIHKIDINSDSIDVFRSHPYITWNVAKAIVNYRNQHGKFMQMDDLKRIKVIDEALLNKIYPYLTLD